MVGGNLPELRPGTLHWDRCNRCGRLLDKEGGVGYVLAEHRYLCRSCLAQLRDYWSKEARQP